VYRLTRLGKSPAEGRRNVESNDQKESLWSNYEIGKKSANEDKLKKQTSSVSDGKRKRKTSLKRGFTRG